MRYLFIILFSFSLSAQTTGLGIDSIPSFNTGKVLAFPGAEGWGRYATGGRGGTVIHVTNLNDSGAGSFRAAVDATGPRIVVFDVSGTITLTSALFLDATNDDLTIAGQTAPGPINIRHIGFAFFRTENVIIRHVNFSWDVFQTPPATAKWALGCDGCRNVIIDHCGFEFTQSNALVNFQDDGIPQGNITFSRNILGDGVDGVIMGATAGVPARTPNAGRNSFIKNLAVHTSHRFPNFQGDGRVDIINNLIYNNRFRNALFYNTVQANEINNYLLRGSVQAVWADDFTNTGSTGGGGDSKLNYVNKIGNAKGSDDGMRIYVSGNKISGLTLTSQEEWDRRYAYFAQVSGLFAADDTPPSTTFRAATPFEYNNNVSLLTADQVLDSIPADVGAYKRLNADGTWFVGRMENDATRLDDVANITCWGCTPDGLGYDMVGTNHQSTITYSTITSNSRSASYDTDSDGMADVWETATFGDLTRDGTGDFDADGWTDVEEFLNLVDAATPSPPVELGKVINARGGRVRVNGKFMRIKTN